MLDQLTVSFGSIIVFEKQIQTLRMSGLDSAVSVSGCGVDSKDVAFVTITGPPKLLDMSETGKIHGALEDEVGDLQTVSLRL